ncbi:MAG: hypothetical protein ACUZ8H_00190 [Candidatus Anammoxibacter sp.]
MRNFGMAGSSYADYELCQNTHDDEYETWLEEVSCSNDQGLDDMLEDMYQNAA